MDSLPPISPSLVQALDKMFPPQCAKMEDSDRLIWYKAGQRSVVEFLLEHSTRQNETLMDRL